MISHTRGFIGMSVGLSVLLIGLWIPTAMAESTGNFYGQSMVMPVSFNDELKSPATGRTSTPDKGKIDVFLEDFHRTLLGIFAPPAAPGDQRKFLEEGLNKAYGRPEARKRADAL